MIKEIKVPYGKNFVHDGGTLVKGDTNAYYLSIVLPEKSKSGYTALAVNQETGSYSDDTYMGEDGRTVSVRLVNSMYNTEGTAVIRLVITDGDKCITVKEVHFDVHSENNTATIAEDEPNILNMLTEVKNKLDSLDSFDLSDYYTKTEVDEKCSGFVTKTEVDEKCSEFVTKAELDGLTDSIYRYKGSLEEAVFLPLTGVSTGDVYNIEDNALPVCENESEDTSLYSVAWTQCGDDYTDCIALEIPNLSTSYASKGSAIGIEVIIPEYFGGGTTFLAGTVYEYVDSDYTLYLYDVTDSAKTDCMGNNFSMVQSMLESYDDAGQGNYFDIKRITYGFSTSVKFNPGTNVAWDGYVWDSLGTTVDVTNVSGNTGLNVMEVAL